MRKEIEELYIAKYDNFIRQVYRRAGTEHNAEDIVHNAFTLAMNYYAGFDPTKGNLEGWMRRIVENELKKFMNLDRHHGAVDIDEVEVEAVENPSLISRKFAQMVKKHKEQDILRLHYCQGYRAAEISDLTGKNVDAVYKILQRFKQKVVERLAEPAQS